MKPKNTFKKHFQSASLNIVLDIINNLPKEKQKFHEEFKQILENRELKYSNDYSLDLIVSSLIKNSTGTIKDSLKKVYIGRISFVEEDISASAENLDNRSYLILISNRLGLIIDVISELYTLLILRIIKNSKENNLLLNQISKNIETKINLIRNLTENKDIKSDDKSIIEYVNIFEDYKKIGISLANIFSQIKRSIYYFIIFHELGHHQFKHVEFDPEYLNSKDNLTGPSQENTSFNREQKQEFRADKFAYRRIVGNLIVGKKKKKELFGIDNETLIIGGYLFYLSLMICFGNIYKRNDSHPSLNERLIKYHSFALKNTSKKEILNAYSTLNVIIVDLIKKEEFNELTSISQAFLSLKIT